MSKDKSVYTCSEWPYIKVGQKLYEVQDVINYRPTKGLASLSMKAFMHLVVCMKSDRSTCFRNEKVRWRKEEMFHHRSSQRRSTFSLFSKALMLLSTKRDK